MDLIAIAILTAVIAPLLAFVSVPEAASAPLGLFFLLFTPGYALTAALYPRRSDLRPLERLALSFGLSLAVVPLIALALNYSPWGVHWQPLLAFVGLLTVLACAAGLLHRRLTPASERFTLSLSVNLSGRVSLSGMPRGAATVAVLAPLTALAVVLLIWLAAERTGDTPYTEFYLLGPTGRPDSLPSSLVAGDEVTLTTGIINREGEEMVYSISASIGGTSTARLEGIRLEPGQRWLRSIAIRPSSAGDGQLVEFDLYTKESGRQPYRTLYLWLNVLEPLAPPQPVLAEEEGPEPERPPAEEPEPTPEPEEPEEPEPPRLQPQVYEVEVGDCLSIIANRYDVPLESVITANPIDDPNLIYPQQQIMIPPNAVSSESE